MVHVDGSVDAFRDAETMLLELTFADLEMIDRRLARLSEGMKGAKAPERDAILKEQGLFARLKERLEAGEGMRGANLAADEERLLAGFGLLSAKPVIVLVNIGEEQLDESAELYARAVSQFQGPMVKTAVLCGALEMDLAQMEPEEAREMREGLGVGESGLDRMIALTHKAAGAVTFFTGNDNEVHAWTAPRGTGAAAAAGRIHSDFERGFIRAEVIAASDLQQCGSIAAARSRGLLRQEGRTYEVQEGDVLNILFSV